jgi:hypothetical protein
VVITNYSVCYAQKEYNQTIRGKVVDKQTEIPLSGATIILLDTDPFIGTSSDVNGNFRFDNVKTGRYNIQISFIGYSTLVLDNQFLSTGKELILNIELEETFISTSEVVVKRDIKKDQSINEVATVSARTFTIEETERYSGSIGDPARMAANFAGIGTLSDQRNDIVIRGNSPLGILWRLDGIEIPNPNHFSSFGASGGPISILNNNLLTNSDFFTGAFPAEYGNALSGVFDLKMREGNNEKREYVLQVGMNGFEAGTEGPIIKSKSSYLVSYRYSTLAVVDAMGFKVGINSIPFFQDASFKISSSKTEFGKFSLIGIGGYSYVKEYDSKADTIDWTKRDYANDNSFGSGMGVVALLHKFFINNNTRIVSSITTSYTISQIKEDTFTLNIPIPEPYYRQKSVETGYTFSSELIHKFNLKHNIQFGVSYQILNYQFADSIVVNSKFNTNIDAIGTYSMLKSFFQYQFKINKNVSFYAGVHYLLFTLNNSWSLEPRGGFKWTFFEKHSLNLGFGLHSQLPPRSYFLVESEKTENEYDELNQNLGFAKSGHLVLGYNWLITENLRLKTETYYQYLYEIPVKEGLGAYSMLNFGDSYFSRLPVIDSLINKGTGTNCGLEITVEKFLDNGYYWLLTASLYESKYKGFDKIERNTAFNGNYILNFLAGKEFQLWTNHFLSLNAKITYSGGLRYIPYSALKVANDYFVQIYDWENAYEEQRDDYFRINGRLGYKINFRKLIMELAIDFMNITNHKDIFTEYFNNKTGETSYTYQFSFLPIGFLRFQF